MNIDHFNWNFECFCYEPVKFYELLNIRTQEGFDCLRQSLAVGYQYECISFNVTLFIIVMVKVLGEFSLEETAPCEAATRGHMEGKSVRILANTVDQYFSEW